MFADWKAKIFTRENAQSRQTASGSPEVEKQKWRVDQNLTNELTGSEGLSNTDFSGRKMETQF
jgi:hypothetical protein